MSPHRCLTWLASFVLIAICSGCSQSPTTAAASGRQPSVGVVVVPTGAPGPQVLALPADRAAGDDGSLFQLSEFNPSQGSADAPITVVAFGSLQCQHTATAMQTLDGMRARYPLNVLRVVWKNFPIQGVHPQARAAAEAGMAVFATAGSAAFFCFSRAMFANRTALSAELYRQTAGHCGASAQAMEAEVASGRPAKRIVADLELASSVQVVGTPTLFINGIRVEGAEQEDKLSALFDAEAFAVRKTLGAGTPARQLHAERVRNNFKITADDSAGAPEPIDSKIYKVAVGSSPVIGPATAPITIVVFSDFQCPFCKDGAARIADVRREYAGKVRIAFKHMPLMAMHPRAEPASQFAMEARAQQGDAGFWRAHDALFVSAPQLEDPDFDLIATALRLDRGAMRLAVSSRKHLTAIEADGQVAESVGVNGTPVFFVNGRRLNGARPIEDFRALIEEVMPAAVALTRRGVPAAQVYQELIKDGQLVRPASP